MKALRHWVVRHAGLVETVYQAGLALVPIARALGLGALEKAIRPIEAAGKGLLFDCQMCGQCQLSVTGMACPMNCPKKLRNGPCGGVREDGMCEIDAAMPCVWAEGWLGQAQMKDADGYRHLHQPLDFRRFGRSTWVPIIKGESDRFPLSQPGPPRPRATDFFEAKLKAGRFVVTAELSPPDSADPEDLLAKARIYDGLVDAMNVTDGSGAHCHLSSQASAALLVRSGRTAIAQIVCRDRNRIAAQADILGLAALGVKNLLCLTGDGVETGDHPEARPVFDLDAVSLLTAARTMRDNGTYLSGRKLTTPPNLFLGATANPFAPPMGARVVNLAKKIAAGAQFIQTQFCFDPDRLDQFLRQAGDQGLLERTALIVGVGPLVSVKMARFMRAKVPGVWIPDALMARMEKARDAKKEGVAIAVEMVARLKATKGVAGVHLMSHRHEDLLAEIVSRSGLRASDAGE